MSKQRQSVPIAPIPRCPHDHVPAHVRLPHMTNAGYPARAIQATIGIILAPGSPT